MTKIAQLYKVDGSITNIEPANGEAFTEEEQQELLGCKILHNSYLIAPNKPYLIMVMDYEGILDKKPENKAAMKFWLKYNEDEMEIAGDVIVCSPSLIGEDEAL